MCVRARDEGSVARATWAKQHEEGGLCHRPVQQPASTLWCPRPRPRSTHNTAACGSAHAIRGASGEIRFTKEPAYIDASLSSHYSDNMYGFEENDIYALELCLLNEMCVNGDEIFAKRVGEPFHCVPDEGKWQSFGRDLLELERGAAWKADAWS